MCFRAKDPNASTPTTQKKRSKMGIPVLVKLVGPGAVVSVFNSRKLIWPELTKTHSCRIVNSIWEKASSRCCWKENEVPEWVLEETSLVSNCWDKYSFSYITHFRRLVLKRYAVFWEIRGSIFSQKLLNFPKLQASNNFTRVKRQHFTK